jgi:hypothetical protein
MAGGRPTKYTKDTPQKVLDWLDTKNDTDEGVDLPTIEGLSVYLGLTKETVYQWEKDIDKKEFSDALRKVRQAQHDRLVNSGLSGKYNPTIAKLILGNNHGYAEKKDLTTGGEKFQPVDKVVIEVVTKKDEA